MAKLKIIVDSSDNALNRHVLETVRKSKGWAKLEKDILARGYTILTLTDHPKDLYLRPGNA